MRLIEILARLAPTRHSILRSGWVAAAVAAGAGAGAAGQQAVVPPPPDYAAGLRSSLDQALADGSNAALILFIARYPDETLTGTARTALKARTAPDPLPPPGPDGTIVAAFDAARLAGPAALAAFAGAYGNHPLAAEAARPVWAGQGR
jgi:hypothetical protein